MRKKLVVSSVVYILSLLKTFSACLITGIAPFYKGKTVKAFYYDNFLTYNQVLVSQAQINDDGSFRLTMELIHPRVVFLKIGNYRVDLYADTLCNMFVKINPPDSTTLPVVNKDIHVYYEISGSSLNADISKLGADIDWFITQNYQKFLLKAAKPVCDTFVNYLEKQYASVPNSFFQTNLKYRLALLELAAYHSNKYLIDKYLNGPILYDNYDYFDFFNQLFHHYVLQFSETQKGEALNKTINQLGSYAKSYEVFKSDKTLSNDTLRELVFLKGLYELYFEPDFNKGAVLECIKQATVLTQYPKNQNLAKLIYEKLTRFNKGNPAPDFTLIDENGKNIKLSSFKGKVVVLTFGAMWNKDYMAELSVLEKYSKKFGKKVQVLNLLMDEPLEIIIEKHKQNRNWKLLSASNSTEILDLYAVKTLPQFFIISKGGWFIEAPAEPPSKWPPEKFEAFFEVK